MAENETVTGSQSDGSAVGWAGKYLQSDLLAPSPTPAGEPATRSLHGSASTGLRTTELSVAPVRFGHYELLERIGQGGMGTVYRVRNLELDRHEAMKLIARNSDDSAARTRFEREFLSLAKIEHQHIVPVYAAGTWDGVPYFTMKFVPGGALVKHLDRFRADPVAAAGLMAKVARAVGKLHAAGVLHRDLKPHNILLGDGDEPLVADFGLVKKLGEDSDASVTGAPMGTRQYMSPEQTFAHKADYTPACDIWAIGVILYELLAGARPFPSTDPVEVYIQIREANPKPLLEVNPAAPPELAAVAHRCLAKAPADRYPSAAAVADDLEAWLSGDAVTATMPPPRRRKRRRAPWVAGAVALVVAALGFGPRWFGPPPIVGSAPPPAPTRPEEVVAALPIAPPPHEALSVGQKLAQGRTVEFVGEKGGFLLPTRPAPGTSTTATVPPDGDLALESVGLAAVELTTDPLPLGTRLEAEVEVTIAVLANSSAGLYAGGREWQSPAGPRMMLVGLLASDGRAPVGTVPPDDQQRVGFELVHYTPTAPVSRNSFAAMDLPVPPAAGAARRWQKVTVVPTADGVVGEWNGSGIPAATTPLLGVFLRLDGPNAIPPSGVAFGRGVGLVVTHAGARYRNVRLVPPVTP